MEVEYLRRWKNRRNHSNRLHNNASYRVMEAKCMEEGDFHLDECMQRYSPVSLV